MIESGTGVVGSLLKELLVHRNRVEVLEQQKQKELELAQARSQIENGGTNPHLSADNPTELPSSSEGVGAGAEPVEATPAEVESAIDELIDEEMCSTCVELLEGLKERPPREQVRGIMEYGTFKHNLDGGAGVEEMKSVIEETDVLQSVFRERFTGPAPEA